MGGPLFPIQSNTYMETSLLNVQSTAKKHNDDEDVCIVYASGDVCGESCGVFVDSP